MTTLLHHYIGHSRTTWRRHDDKSTLPNELSVNLMTVSDSFPLQRLRVNS